MLAGLFFKNPMVPAVLFLGWEFLTPFLPTLLKAEEFTHEPATFDFVDVDGTDQSLALPAGGLGFTLCQIPVVYKVIDDRGAAAVRFNDGSTVAVPDSCFDADLSEAIFSRSGRITRIEVGVPRDTLVQ
jgi:hypothetical protein